MIDLILPDWMLTDSCGRYYLIHEHTRRQTEKHKADVRAMNEYEEAHPWNVAYPDTGCGYCSDGSCKECNPPTERRRME